MNNFDLNAMGVSEMNEVEMKQTEGGLAFLAVAFLCVCVAVAAAKVYEWIQDAAE